MRGVLRPCVLALALSLLPMLGCETKRLWLDLPSFGADAIEGVWLWRWSEQSSRYERACRIPFGAITSIDGVPKLPYVQECADGQAGLDLSATVEYPAADTLRVSLWFMRGGEPGTFKLTSYGARGESSLSSTTLEL